MNNIGFLDPRLIYIIYKLTLDLETLWTMQLLTDKIVASDW